MASRATGLAGFDMSAQCRRAASQKGTPDLRLGRAQGVRFEIRRAVTAQHPGQSQAWDGNHFEALALGQVEQFQWRSGTGQARARQM